MPSTCGRNGRLRSPLVAPEAHVAALPSADEHQRDGLAGVLADVLVRLDQPFAAPMPYMLWIHQRPTDGGAWPVAHVHIHIAPIFRSPGSQRHVAAGKLGSGMWFNPVPEAAAAALRALPGSGS